jgi:biotin operon repressor
MGKKLPKTQEKGIWISREILFNQQLDSTNKILLAKILSFLENGEGSYPSNNYLTKYVSIGRTSVSKRITYLREQGFIEAENVYEDNVCKMRVIFRGEKEMKAPDSRNGLFSSKGLWIPNNILLNNELDPANKILLTQILSLATLKDGCFASNETLGKYIGLSKSSISKRISFLKQKGYINTEIVTENNATKGRFILEGTASSIPSQKVKDSSDKK